MEEIQNIAFQIQDPSRGPVVGWILSIKQLDCTMEYTSILPCITTYTAIIVL